MIIAFSDAGLPDFIQAATDTRTQTSDSEMEMLFIFICLFKKKHLQKFSLQVIKNKNSFLKAAAILPIFRRQQAEKRQAKFCSACYKITRRELL